MVQHILSFFSTFFLYILHFLFLVQHSASSTQHPIATGEASKGKIDTLIEDSLSTLSFFFCEALKGKIDTLIEDSPSTLPLFFQLFLYILYFLSSVQHHSASSTQQPIAASEATLTNNIEIGELFQRIFILLLKKLIEAVFESILLHK